MIQKLTNAFQYHGNKTQKSWKPLLNMIFVFSGLLECLVRLTFHAFV